jgi:hypothetical protein
MNQITRTYTQLKEAGLVTSARSFSVRYLNRSPCWFAYNKHIDRDWSVLAAMSCLRSIERESQHREELTSGQMEVLAQLGEAISAHIHRASGLRIYCVTTHCQ